MEILWKDEYSVGVKEIDDQHKHFIFIANAFYDAILANKGREELTALFQEISDYADEHFATEEKYFDQFNYEEADMHKLKHQEMRNEIKNLRNQEVGNKIDFDGNIVYFIRDWLDDHLKNTDQKYKKCFKEHGLV